MTIKHVDQYNQEICFYDHNNINQTCYCYDIIKEEQKAKDAMQQIIKCCDIILLLLLFMTIGIQFLKIKHI